MFDVLVFKETDDVLGPVPEVRVLGLEDHQVLRPVAVGIFLEGGADDAHFSVRLFQNDFDQLRGAVSGDDLILAQAEVSGGQEGIYVHSRRVLAYQAVKIGLHLVQHFPRRVVAVDQIAEIHHFRIAPVAAVPSLNQGQTGIVLRKKGFGDVQILNVVDFVPLLAVVQALGLDAGMVQHDDHL